MQYDNTQKRENLLILADGLSALPADYQHFDMQDFFNPNHGKKLDEMSIEARVAAVNKAQEIAADYARNNGGVGRCGSVACACGHGPVFGLRAVDADFHGDRINWFAYTYRVFICAEAHDTFEWMFGGAWHGVDNTHHGAAKRIRYYLANGVPEDFEPGDSEEAMLALYEGY